MTIKKKIYLTLIIFVLLIALFIALVILPIFKEIKNDSDSFVSQKERIILLEAKTANLEEFRNFRTEIDRFLKEVENLLVDSELPIEFISFLENISKESGIEINVLSVSDKKTKKDFWPNITFQINSLGYFPDFIKFLEKLENSPYLAEIENISISRLAEKEDNGLSNVRVSFSINVFAK